MDPLRDRLIDCLLHEELGGDTPPDLTDKILARAVSPRRWYRLALGVGCAAGILLAVLWLALRPGYPEPTASGSFEVIGGGPVQRGATLHVGEQQATLDLGGYAHLEIEPESQVSIEGKRADEAVFLETGAVTCEVTPNKGAFSVRTAIGTVSVVGTRFCVTLMEEEGEVAMSHRMLVRVLTGVVLVTGTWGIVELGEGQQQTFAQEKKGKNPEDGKKGTTVGVLVEKGKNQIWVKAAGEEKARRYVPQWKGGQPAQGGGLDKEMLKTFNELKVGSRIEVEWVFEERLRALKIKVLKQGDGPREPKKEQPKPEEGVKNRKGTVTGTLVTNQGGKWIEVKGDGEEKPRKYWVFQRSAKLREAVSRAPIGSRVAVEWEFTGEGPRAIGLEIVSKPKD